MIKIVPIRALKDNYIWIILNTKNNHIIIVDPGESKPVLDFIEKSACKLSAVLITHKHWDHCSGIDDIVKKYPVPVFGPEVLSLKNVTHRLKFLNKKIKINIKINNFDDAFEVMHIPGHTREHIAYYYSQHKILFTGDTLFTGGCGKVFEGTFDQMYQSLQILCRYPDDARVYCGHEYTAQNLKFAQIIEPENPLINIRIGKINQKLIKNLPAAPSTLQEEKETNPFLRCHMPSVIFAVEKLAGQRLNHNPAAVFKFLRQLKDTF